MDDDDMFLNDDDFDDDTKMSKLDEAKIKLANYMITNLQALIESLQYNERANARTKLDIVTQSYGELLELFKLDDKSDLSEEEMSTIIKKIDASTKVMTMANQDDILKELKDNSETFLSDSNISTTLNKIFNSEDIYKAIDASQNNSDSSDNARDNDDPKQKDASKDLSKTSDDLTSMKQDNKPDDSNSDINIDW